jgi:uncharacterized protein (DUF433 family)
MVIAPINHISIDERGVAFISGTSIKVLDIVQQTYVWNSDPAQIVDNYPKLTLAEVHSALAYYHDHKAEMDQQAAESDEEYEHDRAASPNQMSRQQLEERLETRVSDPL